MPDLSVRPSTGRPVQPPSGHEPEAARARHATARAVPIAHTAGSSGLVASHLARTTSAAAAPPSPKQLQKRLEAYFEQMSGPYTVNGKQVRVPAGFRMKGGMKQRSIETYAARIHKALPHDVFQTLALDVGRVASGKGTPAQVRRVTQALIDSPAFKPYAKLPPGKAIRHMAWQYGVGVDCSGYVHSAFLYSRGVGDKAAPASRYGLHDAGTSGLQNLPGSLFRRVTASEARPGDVIKLSAGPDGSGHKVIVMSRDQLDRQGPEHAAVAKELGSARDARILVLTVASSWGANGDPDHGGVKQESWALDQSTGRWASLVRLGSGHWTAFASSKDGPYDHKLDGVFRPRTEK